MTSNINASVPTGPQAFGADLRANLAAAKAEIEALQPGSRVVGNYKAWEQGEAVTAGDRRTNGSPRRTYEATTSGTTGATAPVGTGSAIDDGAVLWNHLRASIFTLDDDAPPGSSGPATAALIDLSDGDIFYIQVIATENPDNGGVTRLKLPPAPNPAGRRMVIVERDGACTAAVELYGLDSSGQGAIEMTQPDRWVSAIWSTANSKWQRGPSGFSSQDGYREYLANTAVGGLVRLVDVGGGQAGLPAVDGSKLTGVAGGGGSPESYQPLVHTLVEGDYELLDDGTAGSGPLGTWRVYTGGDVVVEVTSAIAENAQWIAQRECDSLTYRSVQGWGPGQSVASGDRRWLEDSGPFRVYIATSTGTTGATPPSGTGTDIDDGGVIWDYEQDGGPVTFRGQASIQIVRGNGGLAYFLRPGVGTNIEITGSGFDLPVHFRAEEEAVAVRSGSDLVLDLDQATVFTYSTDATAVANIVFEALPAVGAVSVMLRLTRAGAGALAFGGVDFGDEPSPALGDSAGDALYVTFIWDGSTWAAIRSWSKTA